MKQKARMLPSFLIFATCLQCVTSNAGTPLTQEKSVLIQCKYVSRSRTLIESDVECIIQNKGSLPAKIKFEKLAVSDPDSSIVPIDVTRISSYEAFQTIMIILGVVVVLGAIVLMASKSNYIGNVHVGVPDSPLPRKTIKMSSGVSEAVSVDVLEIPQYRSVVLAFKIKHRAKRPASLLIQLNELPGETLSVPIQEYMKASGKSSDFDY